MADTHDPLAPFRWHPEPELIGIRDAGDLARRARGGRRGDLAREPSTGCTTRRWSARWACRRGSTRLRREYFGETGGPGPAPVEPVDARRRARRVHGDRSRPTRSTATTRARCRTSRRRRSSRRSSARSSPSGSNQGIDVWHAGPVGAFVEEEVVRWLCDLVGYGEGSFGLLASGGVMANFIAMALVRDVHLRALRGARAAAARGRARGRPRVHERPDALLDRAGARRAGLPARDARRSLPADDALPPPRRAGRRGDRRGPGARPDPRSRSAPSRARRTRAPSTSSPELAALARREGLWFHVDAAYGGAARLSERDAGRVPGLELADSVTVDPHKWFFQAYDLGALLVRDGGHLRADLRPLARVLPRRRGAGGRTATTAASDDDHAGQLNFYKLGFEGTRRFRALKLWASWNHLGTSGLGRLVEANDDVAAYLAQRCARGRRPRGASPPEPELSVVCFRHLPGGAAAAARDGPGARSTPTRTASRPRSRPPATAGCRRRPCAARRTCAPASSTTSRRRPTSTGSSRPSGRSPTAWLRRRIDPRRRRPRRDEHSMIVSPTPTTRSTSRGSAPSAWPGS